MPIEIIVLTARTIGVIIALLMEIFEYSDWQENRLRYATFSIILTDRGNFCTDLLECITKSSATSKKSAKKVSMNDAM
ncbi:hypothetical protein Glove_52g49 [Diversispora epigaea]|uniref:Uncharacterized protein n=1 Tax=Diversispora epigaea TaxID=1348612 RepID=A0A397JJW7_9GLOM|nr:hypothetical protein Glove_52g49 [Diversispora epigaea]